MQQNEGMTHRLQTECCGKCQQGFWQKVGSRTHFMTPMNRQYHRKACLNMRIQKGGRMVDWKQTSYVRVIDEPETDEECLVADGQHNRPWRNGH